MGCRLEACSTFIIFCGLFREEIEAITFVEALGKTDLEILTGYRYVITFTDIIRHQLVEQQLGIAFS